MSIKLVSFDLQGTLCDHSFSSEIWLTLLPKIFEERLHLLSEQEYISLKNDFIRIDQKDLRYYDIEYWLKRAGSTQTTKSLAQQSSTVPKIFPEMKKLVEYLITKVPVIIISATTHSFIDLELEDWREPFSKIYSTFDDFHIPGKPPEVFSKIASTFQIQPSQCFHIGDHEKMDGISPLQAGWLSLFDPSETASLERAIRALSVLKKSGL